MESHDHGGVITGVEEPEEEHILSLIHI